MLGTDPVTGLEISVRDGRYGPYVQLGEQEEGSKKKPKRASLFKTMTPDTVTLDQALMLLSLPRVVGQDAEGRDIVASPGRFGPYIKRGEDTRSLREEDQLLTVTLEEALELLAQPKRGRGRQSAEPLAELGVHPDNGATVKLMPGRYGPYVTDGTTNASLPKDADPATATLEQAVELLRARAAAGPAKKPARKAAGAKKTDAKSRQGGEEHQGGEVHEEEGAEPPRLTGELSTSEPAPFVPSQPASGESPAVPAAGVRLVRLLPAVDGPGRVQPGRLDRAGGGGGAGRPGVGQQRGGRRARHGRPHAAGLLPGPRRRRAGRPLGPPPDDGRLRPRAGGDRGHPPPGRQPARRCSWHRSCSRS